MAIVFTAAQLRHTVSRVIEAAGSSPQESRAVAENLVLANLSGHDSHGVGMVPRYVEAVLEGGLQPNASAEVRLDAGSLLALDGRRGYGQIVGEQAMRLAMARAQATGSCVMALSNAHHLGRIGHFAEMAVAQGLVSVHFVNVLTRPVVAPWGGGDGRYGTNPFCVGVPMADRDPFVLDFATSRVAQGKMRVAYNEGRAVDDGYLIDERGQPTNNPGVVVVPQSNGFFGALLPFGEHKGFGMAVACELLGGALTGNGTWHRPADSTRAVVNGMFTILVDPGKLGTRANFEQEALAFADWLRQSPSPDDTSGVLLAGEPERRARAERERHGISLDQHTWAEIEAAGAKVGARYD